MTFDPAFVLGLISAGCRSASASLNPAIAFAIFGAALSVASVLMKRMVPLRAIALAANASFFAFGLLERNVVMLLLHGSMLPVNAWRLQSIRKLVRESHLESTLSRHY